MKQPIFSGFQKQAKFAKKDMKKKENSNEEDKLKKKKQQIILFKKKEHPTWIHCIGQYFQPIPFSTISSK
jgi:hypothetical protein